MPTSSMSFGAHPCRLLPRVSRAALFIFASLLALSIANAAPAPASSPTPGAVKDGAGKDEKPHKEKSSKGEHSAAVLPKDVKKLIVEDTIVGNGKTAAKGKTIKVQYTGWLYDPSQPMGRGKQFDSSIGKEPFSFALGSGLVIKGWDEGFDNMKVGGKRKLIVPSDMAYGNRGAGADIPPNSALMFEVELLDVN